MSEITALRQYRIDKGLTLAAQAAEFGCTIAALSRWELGKRTPRDPFLKKINQATGIPVAKLMGISEESPPVQPADEVLR